MNLSRVHTKMASLLSESESKFLKDFKADKTNNYSTNVDMF